VVPEPSCPICGEMEHAQPESARVEEGEPAAG
jgi:hypothetical protein